MPYYISVNNVQQGPMEEADIRDKVSRGEIPVQNSLFWKEGMPTWAPLSQLVGSVPPPLTPAAAPAPMPTPPLTPAAAPAPVPTQPYPAQQMPPQPYPAQQVPPQPYPAQQMPPQPYPAQQMPPQPYPAVPPPVSGQAQEYNPINAFVSGMKRYAMFTGRASRSEYWFFFLADVILCLIPFVGQLWMIAGIIPGIAVAIRRMHDVGKSGWFGLIPIYSLVLCCTPSEGPNQYGPGPLPPER